MSPITEEVTDETHRRPLPGKGARAAPNTLAYLLINCSRPCLLSSMNDSSKIPSSPRKGSCRFKAFPGSGGTTICRQTQNGSHSGELTREVGVKPCAPHFLRHTVHSPTASNLQELTIRTVRTAPVKGQTDCFCGRIGSPSQKTGKKLQTLLTLVNTPPAPRPKLGLSSHCTSHA